MFKEDRQNIPTIRVISKIVNADNLDVSGKIFTTNAECILMYVVVDCTEDWIAGTIDIGDNINTSRFLVNSYIPKTDVESPAVINVSARLDSGVDINWYKDQPGIGQMKITIVILNIEDLNMGGI